jgi:hypothetical protein
MGKKKKPPVEPTHKVKLTLYFDTEQGRENFMAWYLDGGGEQGANYCTQKWTEEWMYLVPPDDACPECEYYDEGVLHFFWKNLNVRKHEFRCSNCTCRFSLRNPYPGE